VRGIYEKVKGSGDWYIHYFDADGRRHRQHVGRHSAAVLAYFKKKQEIREGQFVSPAEKRDALTFEDLFKKRMADMKRSLSRWTYDHHESNLNHPRLASLKSLRARKVRPSDIEAVLSGMHDDGLSDGTIRNYRALISAVFAYGVRQDYFSKNPVLKTIAPKQAKQRVRFLSADEEESIRKVVRDQFPEREPELDLLLHTGMRSGEAYGLTWDRVHLERGLLDVPESGKTGWRDIPINRVCRAALEQLHRQSKGSAFVIPRAGTRRNHALTRWFGAAIRKSGVLYATPHTLRHTFASRLVMAGVNLKRIQEFLGHASIHMTMKYAHLVPERGQVDIDKLCPQKKPPVRARPRPAQRRLEKIA